MSGLTQSVIATAQRALNPGSAVFKAEYPLVPSRTPAVGGGLKGGVIFPCKRASGGRYKKRVWVSKKGYII